MKKYLLVIFLAININLFAQVDSLKPTKFILEMNLLDIPYNTDNNFLSIRQFSPGMQSSLSLSSSLYQTQKYYTKRLFFNPEKKHTGFQRGIRYAGLILSDFLIEGVIVYAPLGEGWLHEEWHRSVMYIHNIRSFNDMNTFPIGAEIVSVNSVTDDDLIRLKSTSNPDMVRMHIAGIEGQYELVKRLQKENFYNELNLPMAVKFLMSISNSVGYVNFSATEEADVDIQKYEEIEGDNIKKRDFTGWDFTAYIYDLSRPEENYRDRGIHPSGIGIRRYRRISDLNNEELDYLKKMGELQYINFINPGLLFINSIKVNENFRFNFSGFHYLTSFGDDIGSNFMFDYKGNKVFLALHNYRNFHSNFYGIEGQIVDKEILINNLNFNISPSLHLWTQPKNQDFRTSDSFFGGKAELQISNKLGKYFSPYVVVAGKTKGWVAGDVYLDEKISTRFGTRVYIR